MIAPFDPNLTRIELRQDILRHLHRKGWKRKDLARFSAIEAVTISNLLNNKQCFMLYQLDSITQALDLPAGHFYAFFKAECSNHEGRIRPLNCSEFILRCLELGKREVADDFVDAILEEKDRSRRSEMLLDFCVFIEHVHLLPLHYRDDQASEEASVINLRFQAYSSMLLYYSVFERWNDLFCVATMVERFSTHADDPDYLGEALHYQIVALRGQGEREKALTIVERLATINERSAKIAEEQRMLLTMEGG